VVCRSLDRLLADDFVGTNPTADTYTKTNAIDDLKNAKYVVESMNLDDISVNAYGGRPWPSPARKRRVTTSEPIPAGTIISPTCG
jgi:uncharacterized protein DUF4440